MKRLVLWLGLTAVAAALVGSAHGAKPTIERIAVHDIGVVDEFLTEVCGVPVTLDVVGHVIVRSFDGDGTGPVELLTLNLTLTAHAGDNSYRLRDVGADLVRVTPDGTLVLMIIGQVPFGFTGVLKLDETGEAILEPQHSLEERVDAACAALTA